MTQYQTPSFAYNLTNSIVAINKGGSSDKKTSLVSSSDSMIDRLVKESQHWYDNAYRTSNDQLYDLLTKCYGYYFEMGKSNDLAKSLRKGLDDHIEARGYRFNSGTHTLNKIVKCVFGFDRRRVSAYGTALKIALQLKVPVNDLADFIRQHGGIEEVRLSQSSNTQGISVNDKADRVASIVESTSLGLIQSEVLCQQLDAGKVGKNTLLVGTWQADGSILVRAVIDNESLVKTALASQYSKLHQANETKTAEKKTQTKNTARAKALDQAVESARLAA